VIFLKKQIRRIDIFLSFSANVWRFYYVNRRAVFLAIFFKEKKIEEIKVIDRFEVVDKASNVRGVC